MASGGKQSQNRKFKHAHRPYRSKGFNQGVPSSKAALRAPLLRPAVGVQALGPGVLTPLWMEKFRILIKRATGRGTTVRWRTFPDTPVSRKAEKTRMGKGKGAVDRYVAVVKTGQIVVEVYHRDLPTAPLVAALRATGEKFPFPVRIVPPLIPRTLDAPTA